MHFCLDYCKLKYVNEVEKISNREKKKERHVHGQREEMQRAKKPLHTHHRRIYTCFFCRRYYTDKTAK